MEALQPTANATGGTPGTNKSFTITQPDFSTVTLTRSDASGAVAFGLLTKTEWKNSGGTLMAKSELTYANDPGGQPQIQNVISYDDATPTPNQTKVDFDYDGYGNVLNRREYGFQDSGQWKARRRTRNVFKTDTAYLNAYLRSLVIENDVYDAQLDTGDANDILIAKSTYLFDDYNQSNPMENYGGAAFPPGHYSSYDITVTVRGNCTSETIFTDVSAPASTTWEIQWDIFGNQVKRQLACCNEQTITFTDANGYALPEHETKGASGGPQVTSSATYDFNTSTTTTTTDPNNLITTINTRDAALRPTLITYPTGATASATYNDNTPSQSKCVSYMDGMTPKTICTSTVYDNWGRVIQEVDANGAQTNTAYDAMGRIISRTNPFPAGGTPGGLTSYTYDALGRTTVVTLPDSQTVNTSYNGNAVTVTDQVNRKIQRLTDGLGRLVTVNEQDVTTGQLTQATNYSYDYLDKLTEVNQGGQLRKYKYDAIGRLLFDKIPEQSATINDGTGTYWTCKYTYTTFNAVATKQDARGVIGTYSYDSLNRVIQVSYNTVAGVTTAPTVTYTWDSDPTYGTSADGMVVRVNVGTDYQERYTFEPTKRVSSTIRTIGTRTYTTNYQYNQISQWTQLTYPSSRAINVSHDYLGRLSGLAEGGNGSTWLANVSYNGIGQITGDTLGNGITEVFGYDANRMQLTSQKAGTTSPYTNRMDLTYNYQASAGQMGAGSIGGNAGQLMSISGTIGGSTESAAYTYDNLARLVTSNQTSNGSSAQRRFAFDRWGNRSEVWGATSGGSQIQSLALEQSGGAPTNRITSVSDEKGTANYSYDAAGNVTNDGVHSCGYDSENRIVSVDGGSTASYAYDHQNRRYKKTIGSMVTHYVWQGSQVLAEHNGGTGAVLVDYVYFGGRMIGKVGGGSTQYFLSDRLSARVMLDVNAAVIGRQSALPFGEDFAESDTQEKHPFTSYERDQEAGTDYAVNRSSQFLTGRFAQVDRDSGNTELPQTLNRYSYGRNDPINTKDPLGLFIFDCSSRNRLFPFGVTFLLDGIEIPEILCIVIPIVFIIVDPPQRPQRHPFPGFSDTRLKTISTAKEGAAALLGSSVEKHSCAQNLGATTAKSGRQINEATLREALLDTFVKPLVDGTGRRTDPSIHDSILGHEYNVFDGSASDIPGIRQLRGRDVGAVDLDGIFLFDEFFTDRATNPFAKIGLDQTRAIAFLHEVIHTLGFNDDDFGTDPKWGLQDFIIKSCVNKSYDHNDTSF